MKNGQEIFIKMKQERDLLRSEKAQRQEIVETELERPNDLKITVRVEQSQNINLDKTSPITKSSS